MKFITVALVVCLGTALAPQAAFAQKKRPAAEGRACLTAGQTCSTECNKAGYCIRMVCAAGKWKKRAVGCLGTLCPPAC